MKVEATRPPTLPPSPAPHTSPEAVALLLDVVASGFRSPSEGLRRDLESGAFQAALEELSAAGATPAPELVVAPWTELRSAYVALFVSNLGGVAAPPYTGFALDGELLGPSAQGLKAFLAHHGVEIASSWNDLPDHVAAVAEAAALLQRAERFEAAAFLRVGYLTPWFDRYQATVREADSSGFYGPLATFVHSSLKEVSQNHAA